MAGAPDWHRLSDGDIIDLIGAAKAQRDKLENLAQAMSAELLRRGFEAGDGTFFRGKTVASYVQWHLNRKALTRDHGEAFVDRYSKPQTVSAYIKVDARDEAAAEMVQAAVE